MVTFTNISFNKINRNDLYVSIRIFSAVLFPGPAHLSVAGGLVPRPYPLTREKRSGEPSLISWASAHPCNSVTQQRSKHFASDPLKRYGCSIRICNSQRSHNLIGLYHFLEISPRNLALFTIPFLTGRHAWAGHETSWEGISADCFVVLHSTV